LHDPRVEVLIKAMRRLNRVLKTFGRLSGSTRPDASLDDAGQCRRVYNEIRCACPRAGAPGEDS